jgi:HEPN domain-containing protein
MKPRDEVLKRLVRNWVSKAEADLAACDVLSKQPSVLGGIVAFHAQQVVEKYMKAVLTFRQVDFRKTHDLGILLSLLAVDDESLRDELISVVVLTDYGVEVRYPGDLPEVSTEEAVEAVRLARLSRDVIGSLLPPELLSTD